MFVDDARNHILTVSTFDVINKLPNLQLQWPPKRTKPFRRKAGSFSAPQTHVCPQPWMAFRRCSKELFRTISAWWSWRMCWTGPEIWDFESANVKQSLTLIARFKFLIDYLKLSQFTQFKKINGSKMTSMINRMSTFSSVYKSAIPLMFEEMKTM